MASTDNNDIFIAQKFQSGAQAALSLPRAPPAHKRHATQPLAEPPSSQLPPLPEPAPPRPSRRSSFISAITAWAAHVQPGSPVAASPRRGSESFRPFNAALSHFSSGITHGRVRSSSFVATPTTAYHKTFDFTAVGYNAMFAHVPKTPEPPSPLLRAKAEREREIWEAKMNRKAQAKAETKEKRDKMVQKIKSLTTLRPRAKTFTKGSTLPSPVPPVPALVSSLKQGSSKEDASARKKAVYGSLTRQPPTLANELALMQFADGGKMDSHIQRVMATESGVGDVYRDGKGGIWLDRDEELEYRGLLVPEDSESEKEVPWVTFNPSNPPSPSKLKAIERRGSSSSGNTLDSDVDLAYLVQTDDEACYHDQRILDVEPDLVKPGQMILSLPSRPYRAAKHLRQSEYVVDMRVFGLAMANAARDLAGFPRSPRSPLLESMSLAEALCATAVKGDQHPSRSHPQ